MWTKRLVIGCYLFALNLFAQTQDTDQTLHPWALYTGRSFVPHTSTSCFDREQEGCEDEVIIVDRPFLEFLARNQLTPPTRLKKEAIISGVAMGTVVYGFRSFDSLGQFSLRNWRTIGSLASAVGIGWIVWKSQIAPTWNEVKRRKAVREILEKESSYVNTCGHLSASFVEDLAHHNIDVLLPESVTPTTVPQTHLSQLLREQQIMVDEITAKEPKDSVNLFLSEYSYWDCRQVPMFSREATKFLFTESNQNAKS